MQILTSLQMDNYASISPLSFYRPDAFPAIRYYLMRVKTKIISICLTHFLVEMLQVCAAFILFCFTHADGLIHWLRCIIVVTAEDDGVNAVRVCIVLPGLVKKFASSKAKNAIIDVQFSTR